MTKSRRTVKRWSRLAVVAAMPLVLAVCYTPPVAVDQLLQPGSVLSFRPSAAPGEMEPVLPSPPSVVAGQMVLLHEPASEADLVFVDRSSTAVPAGSEPEAPSWPSTELTHQALPGLPVTPEAGLPVVATEPSAAASPEVEAVQNEKPVELKLAGPDSLIATEPSAPPAPKVAIAYPMSLGEPEKASVTGPLLLRSPTEADFNAVRILIVRAEEVDANFYDPENLQKARSTLRTAERIRSIDPGGAHIALREAAMRARTAFENSVRLAAERLRLLLADRIEELREIQADKWLPLQFSALITDVEIAESLFKADDVFGAYRLALGTARAMAVLRDSLINRLNSVYEARAETERYLDEVQKVDAQRWAAEELKKLNSLYLLGLEAMQDYRLADAEEAFGSAVELGKMLMRLSIERRDTTEMERSAGLLIAVREEIEAASQLNVVTDIGDWIKPDRWAGVEVLDALRGDVEQRDAVLRTLNFEDTGALRRAQALWVEGVIEHDMRNFGQAIELFLAARRYVEVYKLYAVKTVYTVRLIPERRDCLWRIAEYDFIYDDPFLWPKIWRRNRELIQNPDLIHPGWQLIIPAL